MAMVLLAVALQLAAVLDRVTELAQKNDLAGAERLALEAVHRAPQSRDAQLALARVYLWEGRYREARAGFAALLARHPNDNDAKRGLAEIEAQSRPGYVVEAGAIDDDQPSRSFAPAVSVYGFSDPLTKWTLSASALRMTTDFGDGSAASVRGGGATTFFVGQRRFTAAAGLGWTRFPDHESRLMPDARIEHGPFSLSFERRALLRSAPAVHSHPFADVTTVRWSPNENAAVSAAHYRYFDHNSGNSADAYWLFPIRTFSIGGAAAYRDTKESRFVNGIYDPYWTPIGEREARAVAAAKWHRIHLHLDGGVAYDRIAGTFHPWRAAASTSIPLPRGAALNVSAERSRSAFYTANEIHASVAGRF
jgi:tetratricopeptide repeat protein